MRHVVQPLPRHYTLEEYLALEERSEVRYEFFEGQVSAMAAKSVAHNTLALNTALACRQALRGKGCLVLMEGVRLLVQEGRHYAYPDVLVSCDPDDQRETRTLRHPVLLAEVLSPESATYDRALKFNKYKHLTSLRHYILISQQHCLVEWYRHDGENRWLHAALTQESDTLDIIELNLTLTVGQLYEDTGVAPLRPASLFARELM